MESKSHASATLFLALNLLFLSLVTATYCPPPPCKPCTKPTPTPKPKSPPSAPKTPKTPTPTTPKTPPAPVPSPPTPTPTTPSSRSCPRDVLQLGACGNLLGGLVNVVVGSTPSNKECCSLLQGLADLDAAICLCTAIKANVLGINLNVPISLSLLLNSCGYSEPSNFQCA
ncbi:hypothetical protein ACHQM5_001000 [Ranunculus cassubicifolius]